ncbi:hypothetical protein FRB90_011836 [Tulasnella sp. 427]|nr:hypothetical protein FRB90_011836 [Tulasnella sp. 427]
MLKPPEQSSRTHGQDNASAEQTAKGNEKDLLEFPHFQEMINSSFGSLAGLKSTFGAAGMGMFGSGWVWLVADTNGDLAVVATYGSGTMLVRSREQKGLQPKVHGENHAAVQSNASTARNNTFSRFDSFSGTPSSPVSGGNMRLDTYSSSKGSPAIRQATETLIKAPQSEERSGLGRDLIPLLTCSIHEHCWLRDHGVWGKKEYLKEFWSVVDWRKLGTSYERLYASARKYGAA